MENCAKKLIIKTGKNNTNMDQEMKSANLYIPLCWKLHKIRWVILILCIVLQLNYSWAQTPDNNHNAPSPDRKTVLTISAKQTSGNQNMPLHYETNTSRVESALSCINNYNGDSLLQGNSSQRWSTTFGTQNHYDEIYDLIEDYDKGYFMVGYDVINSTIGDGWNLKTDVNGSLLWDQKLAHPSIYEGFAVCRDSMGNKYVAGVDFSIIWPFLVKFNACGEKEWCTLFKDWGYMWGYPLDVIINDQGNILVLSRLESEAQINQIFLLCYNTDGDLLWAKPYASKDNHPLMSFASGEKLYQVGEDYFINGYCYYPYPDNPNHVWLRPMFIGVDSQFNEKWVLPFGIGDSIIGKAYSTIPISDSVMMGVGCKFLDYPNGNTRNSLMMFINHEGEELGYKRIWGDSIIPGTQDNLFLEVETVNDSMFISSALLGPDEVYNSVGEVVFDTSGHVYNAQIRPNTFGLTSMVKTFDDKYVITCMVYENDMSHSNIYMYKINSSLEQDTLYTNSFVYDSLCPDSIVSGNIEMTDCFLQVKVEETPNPEEYCVRLDAVLINVYPNPSGDIIILEYKNTKEYQQILLQCINSTGQKVHVERILTGQQGSKLNVSEWNSGLYIGTLSNNGIPLGKFKFIVK